MPTDCSTGRHVTGAKMSVARGESSVWLRGPWAVGSRVRGERARAHMRQWPMCRSLGVEDWPCRLLSTLPLTHRSPRPSLGPDLDDLKLDYTIVR